MCTMIPGNHAMFSANNGPSMGHVDHGSSMTSAAAFWQARHMAVATSGGHTHGSTGANFGHHAHIHNHQHHHDAKMAEKIVSELQYLMSKTAAMHLQGRDIGGGHPGGGLGGMGGVGVDSTGGSGGGGGGGGSGSVSSGVVGNGRGDVVKPHQCQQCLKAFSSNHQLVQHIRVHTGEKPYKCSYCDRRFKQLSHVQQHTRLHTGERPYKCHVLDCGRAFIQLSNLQQHLRNHESQLERLKNRPFHCNVCGKGFATESSLRTHNGKVCVKVQQHTSLVGGPNPTCCPLCQKICVSGEALMEHMKYVHKDPNASGVPAKRRSANHPCPVCGKFYVNEGSLRKHLACHPEMASQISSSLRMWPCTVCTAVFTHENGLLSHMDQMRMDPKHQFAAQYVLSRAANERREREALLAAAAMNMSHFAMTAAAGLGGSPSGHSDASSTTRISTPADMKLHQHHQHQVQHQHQHHHQQQQQQQQQHLSNPHHNPHSAMLDYGRMMHGLPANGGSAPGAPDPAAPEGMPNGVAGRDQLRINTPLENGLSMSAGSTNGAAGSEPASAAAAAAASEDHHLMSPVQDQSHHHLQHQHHHQHQQHHQHHPHQQQQHHLAHTDDENHEGLLRQHQQLRLSKSPSSSSAATQAKRSLDEMGLKAMAGSEEAAGSISSGTITTTTTTSPAASAAVAAAAAVDKFAEIATTLAKSVNHHYSAAAAGGGNVFNPVSIASIDHRYRLEETIKQLHGQGFP